MRTRTILSMVGQRESYMHIIHIWQGRVANLIQLKSLIETSGLILYLLGVPIKIK